MTLLTNFSDNAAVPARVAVRLTMIAVVLALSACGSPGGGYFEDDGPGRVPPDVANIPDAVPRVEPRARSGNRQYEVYGKTYVPMTDASGYRERGVASWYGKKFHGRRTSSGETYDMYAMSAAHKTLPLPSYVRVHNLNNGRSVIVRVNDRGPFLHNRLIDLSYAAAAKLGIVGSGTGLVEVELVTAADETPTRLATQKIETRGIGVIASAEAAPLPPATAAAARPTPAPTPVKIYVQAAAFREWNNAEAMRARLERLAFAPVLVQSVVTENQVRLYRVRVGPVADVEEGDRLTEALARQGVRDPLIVVE